MSSSSDDFVYVDDDGNPLPPEQATNVEIYVKFFKNAQENNKPQDNISDVEKKQNRQDSSSALPSSFLAALGGVDKLRETAALLKEGKIEEEGPTKEETGKENQGDDDNNNVTEEAEQKEDGENEDEEDEENEEEESEMYNREDPYEGFSRECTDQLGDEEEEQWVLEEILRRKLKKIIPSDEADAEDGTTGMSPNHRADTLDDYDDDELIAQHRAGVKKSVHNKINNNNNLVNKTATSVPHYLCKWRWYSKPTWETRDALLELGYGNKLSDYDVEHDSCHKTKATRVIGSSKQKDILRILGGIIYRDDTLALNRTRYRSTVFERMFPDYLTWIGNKLVAQNCELTDIVNIAAPACASDFFFRWASQPDLIPFRIFHGTREHNLPSIARMGLKIPGTRSGVTVQNASALGNGIYSATDPSTPLSYARGCNFLVVGVALDPGSQSSVRHHSNWRIFFENDLVVPVWLVWFTYINNSNKTPTDSSRHEAEKLLASGLSISISDARDRLKKYNFINFHHNLTSIMQHLTDHDVVQEGEGDVDAVKSTLTGVGTVARTITTKMFSTANDDDENERNQAPLPGDQKKNKQPPRDPDVKLRGKEVGHKVMSKRLIKQLPRSLKEVYGYQ